MFHHILIEELFHLLISAPCLIVNLYPLECHGVTSWFFSFKLKSVECEGWGWKAADGSWSRSQHQRPGSTISYPGMQTAKNSGQGPNAEKPIGWIGFYDGLFYIQIAAWPSFMPHLTSRRTRNIHGIPGVRREDVLKLKFIEYNTTNVFSIDIE